MISKTELLAIVERHGVPGLGAGIVTQGSTSQIDTAGVRKLGTENPIGRDDLFHIGSCTKFMTTCLTQIAVDENRLSWSDNLGALAGELVLPIHDTLRTMTVAQLITCTSGFPEDRDGDVWPISLDTLRADNDDPRAGRIRLARATVRRR